MIRSTCPLSNLVLFCFFKMIYLHGEESRAKMRAAGQLARKMLDYACSLARVGVSTDEIDAAVHKVTPTDNKNQRPKLRWHRGAV